MAECTCHSEKLPSHRFYDGKRGTFYRWVQCDSCTIAALTAANTQQYRRIVELEAEVDHWRAQVQPTFFGDSGTALPRGPRMTRGDRK